MDAAEYRAHLAELRGEPTIDQFPISLGTACTNAHRARDLESQADAAIKRYEWELADYLCDAPGPIPRSGEVTMAAHHLRVASAYWALVALAALRWLLDPGAWAVPRERGLHRHKPYLVRENDAERRRRMRQDGYTTIEDVPDLIRCSDCEEQLYDEGQWHPFACVGGASTFRQTWKAPKLDWEAP